MRYNFIAASFCLLCPFAAWGMCEPVEPRKVEMVIHSCEVTYPEKVDKIRNLAERRSKYSGLSPEEAEEKASKLYRSYSGAVLSSVSESHVYKVFYQSDDNHVCEQFSSGKLMTFTIGRACCDGDPNPPCYLGFSSYIVDVNSSNQK